MSWEVQTVKQKTSYFNWGISRSYLKRCWPLWAVYFAVLLLCLRPRLDDAYMQETARPCAAPAARKEDEET